MNYQPPQPPHGNEPYTDDYAHDEHSHDHAAVVDEPSPVDAFADWPTKGYDGPQPWDLKELGLTAAAAELGPGERNTVSPVIARAGLPMLTYGSQGTQVRDVAVALDELGYPCSITAGGENPYNVVDASLMSAVEAFRREYGVLEDPSAFTVDPVNNAKSHIGPWTQEAILRAHEHETA